MKRRWMQRSKQRSMGRVAGMAVAAAVAAVLTACGGGGGDGTTAPLVQPVATVSVTLASAQVAAGGATTASAELRNASGAVLTGRTIAWTSSNSAVASIDGVGNVTAISAGTTLISASSEGKSASATLTVIPAPVATVTVTLAQSTVPVGSATQATVTLRDTRGLVVTDRNVAWSTSNQAVATVNASGGVTTVAPGTVEIVATSEGRTGVASLVVLPPPIATVTITGSSRVKAGDTYVYTAVARAADGTVVDRPMTFSVPQTTIATMTAGGVLTPLQAGTFTIRITIDGEVWSRDYAAYNWETFTSNGTQFVTLSADNLITNRFGTSEYPSLVMSCGASGYFFVWVSFTNFVTASGSVAMSFDGGSPFSQTWDELSPSYSTLWKPGSNAVVKAFALQIASASQFGFAFSEFLGSAKAMIFRVGGLSSRLTPLLASCPSNAIVASAGQSAAMLSSAQASAIAADAKVVSAILNDRVVRAAGGVRGGVVPTLDGLGALRVPEERAARRER